MLPWVNIDLWDDMANHPVGALTSLLSSTEAESDISRSRSRSCSRSRSRSCSRSRSSRGELGLGGHRMGVPFKHGVTKRV